MLRRQAKEYLILFFTSLLTHIARIVFGRSCVNRRTDPEQMSQKGLRNSATLLLVTSLPPWKITSAGVGGWRHALNFRDLGGGVKMFYPTRTRVADDYVPALEKFLGPNTGHACLEGGLVPLV